MYFLMHCLLGLLTHVDLLVPMLNSRDIPPPDLSEMEVVRMELADDENAYFSFREAYAASSLETDQAFIMENRKEVHDREAFLDLIARNAEMLHLLKVGNSKKDCQVPMMTDFDTPVPYLLEWIAIGRYLQALANFHQAEGDIADAVQTRITHLKFANLTMAEPETLIQVMVGYMQFDYITGGVIDLVSDPAFEPDRLQALSEAFMKTRSMDAALARALKSEFQINVRLMDTLVSKPIRFATLSEIYGGNAEPALWEQIPLPGYVFHPNRSKEWFRDAYLSIIRNLPLAYAEMKSPDADYLRTDFFQLSALEKVTRENFMGEMMYAMLLPALDTMLITNVKRETGLRAARLALALQRYRQAQGHPPGQLTDLIPDYLEAVPTDPFDGRPFRYDPRVGLIYSVGEDLQDNGGSVRILEGKNTSAEYWGSFETEDVVYTIE